ncbi:ABC transporter permease subunit [Thermoanaerobacterium thermosaccharolyticum]|uniref:carbohydrate ABC transporter permease n=1 Tax=Thermoanaerobacterium thermosaccharolyticum TaxID=1517 RepID=UPI003D2A2607
MHVGVAGVSLTKILLNTILVPVIGTTGGVLSSAFAAYAFARIKFFGSKFWFSCVILTLMIPAQVLIVPQYIIFKKIGFINHLTAIIIPWFFGGAFFIFLIVQFIRGLPIELEEAAEIDGCNKLQTMILVIFPLILPAIVTSSIFSFYWI